MSLHRETALCLTPIAHPWRDALSALSTSLDEHNRLVTAPSGGIVTTVDPVTRVIVDMAPGVDLAELEEPPERAGVELWFCVPLDARIGRDTYDVDVWLRPNRHGATHVVVEFASELFESVRRLHEDKGGIDEAAKFDLLQCFIDTSRTLGADGFGYCSIREGVVPEASDVDTLVRWITLQGGVERTNEPWIVAAVGTARIDPNMLQLLTRPYRYERDGFVLYDLLLAPLS